MKEIGLEELKSIELEILKNVVRFCEEHNLRYFLGGGTLLGAVRHKGFIPWDDDIDIMMPRKDYMFFLEKFNSYNEQYTVHSSFNDCDWYSTFAEVEDNRTIKEYLGFNRTIQTGVNIDIFPIDGTPERELSRIIFFKLLNILARLATLSYQKFNVSMHYADKDTWGAAIKTYVRTSIKFVSIPFARLTRIFNTNLLINKFAMKFDVDTSTFVGVSTFPLHGYKECVTRKGFLSSKKRLFEKYQFSTPKNYDEYLSNLYGDYMKLPPEEKRVSHHDFKAYWK